MMARCWASPLAAAPPLKLGQNIQRKTVPTLTTTRTRKLNDICTDHGEHVAGVGGAHLAAPVMLRVVQHSGHGQSEVGAKQVDEDGVSGVHSPEVVAADDLIDHEDDGLEDGHDHELSGGRDPEHHPEGDEDSGGGEVCGDEGPDIHINEGPGALTLVRTKLNSGGNSILTNLDRVNIIIHFIIEFTNTFRSSQ